MFLEDPGFVGMVFEPLAFVVLLWEEAEPEPPAADPPWPSLLLLQLPVTVAFPAW